MFKKILVLLLTLVICLSFVSCSEDNGDDETNNPSTPWTLGVPQAKANDDSSVISWKAVNKAKGYSVKIGDTEYPTTETQFDISRLLYDAGEYNVKVKATGDGVSILESPWKEVLFTIGTLDNIGFQMVKNEAGEPVSYEAYSEIYDTVDELVFPANYRGWKVESIKLNRYFIHAKKVIISEGYKKIGQQVFWYSSSEEVIIPSTVEEIGTSAFMDTTGLKEITLPASLKKLGDNVFRSSVVENIFIPYGTESMGNMVFMNASNLKSVFIPSSVTSTGSLITGSTTATYYTDCTSKPDGWGNEKQEWNGAGLPVVWGCNLSADKTYIESLVKSTITAPAGVSISAPYRKGYTFVGWTTTNGGTTAEYSAEDLINVPNNTKLYAIWQAN